MSAWRCFNTRLDLAGGMLDGDLVSGGSGDLIGDAAWYAAGGGDAQRAGPACTAWQVHGVKYRDAIVPPRAGRASNATFGRTFPVASPNPMRCDACRRMASTRSNNCRSASSSTLVSWPVLPRPGAGISTSGDAKSTHETSTPSITSIARRVGSRAPVFAPAPSRKFRTTGALRPGTPSIVASPA